MSVLFYGVFKRFENYRTTTILQLLFTTIITDHYFGRFTSISISALEEWSSTTRFR